MGPTVRGSPPRTRHSSSTGNNNLHAHPPLQLVVATHFLHVHLTPHVHLTQQLTFCCPPHHSSLRLPSPHSLRRRTAVHGQTDFFMRTSIRIRPPGGQGRQVAAYDTAGDVLRKLNLCASLADRVRRWGGVGHERATVSIAPAWRFQFSPPLPGVMLMINTVSPSPRRPHVHACVRSPDQSTRRSCLVSWCGWRWGRGGPRSEGRCGAKYGPV